ncbi:tetratricopeptide repeat protein [Lentzea sp. NEAU-D13]|uniref:Tetratricopeptide repeat protein n=1 Tax=Lentzea alba TaxID=2714351 RepID=A0A7C9VR05_9PSEU|nr:tetratricopeptide repeat protein [Lentzea alba]NGY60792.1 tetratricopeptide repeat protein [Lentzea alba]
MRNEANSSSMRDVVQIGTVHGDVHVRNESRLVPRQVPVVRGRFVGRETELRRIRAAELVLITGAGGVGKTWLAWRWAEQHSEEFPDGQLYVNLRGFDPSTEQMSPDTAVCCFLGALGVTPLPGGLQARYGLYQSLVAQRRMLIVLDNAASSEQVVPLLPGGSACTVLVTSRRHLTGLISGHGAEPVALDVLDPADAWELLTARVGEAEPSALAEVLDCCGGLPLALSVVAAQLALRPNASRAGFARKLRERRLETLNSGEKHADVRSALSWSYQVLSPLAAKLFRLMGRVPGSDLGVPGAAALLATPVGEAALLLDELEHLHLVQQHETDRYRMHDLVRLCAAEMPETDVEASMRRLANFYLHTGFGAHRSLNPTRRPIEIDDPLPGSGPLTITDPDEALGWFAAEHGNLLAIQGVTTDQVTWRLAWVMDTFHQMRGHFPESRQAWSAGLAAAERLEDPVVLVHARRLLGNACIHLGDHGDAKAHLEAALKLAVRSADVPGQAQTHYLLARAMQLNGGRNEEALDHARESLRLFETLGLPPQQVTLLNLVAMLEVSLGRIEEARGHAEAALEINRALGRVERSTDAGLEVLGDIAAGEGDHALAVRYYRQVAEELNAHGFSHGVAGTYERIARSESALGRYDLARIAWRQALELYEAQHRIADAIRVRGNLETQVR